MSIVLAPGGFLALDYADTTATLKTLLAAQHSRLGQPDNSGIPVMDHALQPSCSTVALLGSLGLRDERVRGVPRADPRPAIGPVWKPAACTHSFSSSGDYHFSAEGNALVVRGVIQSLGAAAMKTTSGTFGDLFASMVL